MSHRALLTFLVLSLAACTSTPDGTTTTTSSTTTTAPAPSPVEPRYRYEHPVTYDVTVHQDISFAAEGDAGELGEETLPIDADLVSESSGIATYTPESSSETATALAISATFEHTGISGTVNGEEVDDVTDGGVAAELSRIQPVAVTVMVDALGQLLDDGSGESPPFAADLAALSGVTNDLFSTPVGPTFPDQPITAGSVWESTFDEVREGGSVTSQSQVIEHTDDHLVIETETTTGEYTADFSQQFRDLFLTFSELDEETPPDLSEQLEQVVFVITVEASTMFETARFDLIRGVVTDSTKTAGLALTMEFQAPDEDGNLRGFEIRLIVDQDATFRLRS